MNTAIHESYGLGWKLGWVLRGWASLQLLDTYEEERRPVGVRNTARSADAGPRDASGDYLDDLGGRIPHAWVNRGGARVSTLDLPGPGLTVLTGSAGTVWSEAIAGIELDVPVVVHRVDEDDATALGMHRDGALLVRPDGQPVRIWATAGSEAAGSEAAASYAEAELAAAFRCFVGDRTAARA